MDLFSQKGNNDTAIGIPPSSLGVSNPIANSVSNYFGG